MFLSWEQNFSTRVHILSHADKPTSTRTCVHTKRVSGCHNWIHPCPVHLLLLFFHHFNQLCSNQLDCSCGSPTWSLRQMWSSDQLGDIQLFCSFRDDRNLQCQKRCIPQIDFTLLNQYSFFRPFASLGSNYQVHLKHHFLNWAYRTCNQNWNVRATSAEALLLNNAFGKRHHWGKAFWLLHKGLNSYGV